MFLKQGIVHLKIFASFFLSSSSSPCEHYHLNTNTNVQRPTLSPKLNRFTHSYPSYFVLIDFISIKIIYLFSPTRIDTQT